MDPQIFYKEAEVEASSLQKIDDGVWYTTTGDECPHCGNSGLALFASPLGFKERRTQCLRCGASGPTGGCEETVKDLVGKWNWRPFPCHAGPVKVPLGLRSNRTLANCGGEFRMVAPYKKVCFYNDYLQACDVFHIEVIGPTASKQRGPLETVDPAADLRSQWIALSKAELAVLVIDALLVLAHLPYLNRAEGPGV